MEIIELFRILVICDSEVFALMSLFRLFQQWENYTVVLAVLREDCLVDQLNLNTSLKEFGSFCSANVFINSIVSYSNWSSILRIFFFQQGLGVTIVSSSANSPNGSFL